MTARAPHDYERLAELLEYPAPGLLSAAERCRAVVEPRAPIAAQALVDFAAVVAGQDPRDLEELYARTFDLNPSRCMDLGYQIFGETYKRGAFLVKMKDAVTRHGVDPGVELHDHLPVVLRLLARLGPDDEPAELASEVVLPAVEKLLRTFDEEGGPYRGVLLAVKHVLMNDFGVDHVEPPVLPATAVSDASERGGRRLPVFPGFNPPNERHMS